MRVDDFRKVIQERIDCPDEWDFGVERCWKKEIEILSEDIPSTIEFLKTECTSDEYSWISEVIEELAAKTQSKELVSCYRSLMKKFPEECAIYYIEGSVEGAEAELTGGSKNGQS